MTTCPKCGREQGAPMKESADLDRECWDSSDDGEMCWRIRSSGLPLDDDDARLVRRLFDECDQRASVYDLHRLNMLCHQSIGWRKATKR